MEKIKILYFIYNLSFGGTESLVVNWARNLDSRRFEPVIALHNDERSAFRCPEIKKVVLNLENLRSGSKFALPIRLWRNFVKIFRAIKRESPRVIHVNEIMVSLLAIPAAVLCGVPVRILHRHNTAYSGDPLSYIREISGFSKRIKGLFWRVFSKFTTKILTISNIVKDEMAKAGFDSKKLEILPNCVDLNELRGKDAGEPGMSEQYEENLAFLREKFSIEGAYPVLGVVGNIRPQKGHRYLIEALPLIKEKFPRARLLFVGGWERPEYAAEKAVLDKICDELDLWGDVIFAGSGRAADFIPLFDVGILPSVNEGFGLAVLEYFAFSKPVVASAAEGILDIIEDGKNGLLAKPADAESLADSILKILERGDFREKIATEGLKSVKEKFSMEKMIKRLEEIYSE